MNKPFTALLVALLVTVPDLTNAEDWYLAGRLSTGFALLEDITHKGTIGTGAPVGNDFDGSLADEDIDDLTGGIGIALGRRTGNWDIEAEFIWRYRADWDIAVRTYSLQAITNVFTNVATSTLLLNATRDIPINVNWSWEVGAGIGLVANDQEGKYIERGVPGITPQRVFEDEANSTDFSWNAILGVSRKLGESWALSLRYRYIDLGDLHIGPFPSRTGEVFADHTSHELMLSFERRL